MEGATKLIERRVEGQPPTLEIDKRTLPKKIPNNFKHLRYSKKLPLECNLCPYRSRDVGGNGICTVYKQDGLCIIRGDIRKQTEKYHTRDGGELIPLLEEELDSQIEKLKFFNVIESMAGKLDTEVSKRLNSVTNLSKTVNELKTKMTTISLSEKKVLSPEARDEIAKEVEHMITVTRQDGGL